MIYRWMMTATTPRPISASPRTEPLRPTTREEWDAMEEVVKGVIPKLGYRQ